MAKQPPVQGIAYLNARIVPRLGRGATAFSPGFAGVPFYTNNGFAFYPPRAAPPLGLTLFNLSTQGGAPGYPFQVALGGVPLTANPYAVSD